MAGITRQSIYRGPGAAVFGTTTIHDKGGITAEVEQAVEEISSSVSGPMDSIMTDRKGSVRLTPSGDLSAAILAALFPHQTPAFGASIYGSSVTPGTDVPLEIFGMDGKTLKFFNAALTGIPPVFLSAVKTAFGEAAWTCLTANGKLPGETDDFYTTTATAYAKGYPDKTGITGHAYSVAWGELDITDMTGDGAAVNFDLGTEDVTTDRAGTIDQLLSSLAARATLTPLGFDAADLLSMRNVSAARGSSLAGDGDLVITSAAGLVVTLKNAALVSGPCQWGASALRVGQIGFTAHRDASGLLYSVALAAA
jgi:hypothetical protein